MFTMTPGRAPAVTMLAASSRTMSVAPVRLTPMTKGMNQKARDAVVAQIPVGRIGLPEDIWTAVKFALECDYFNARTIDVDGGLSF